MRWLLLVVLALQVPDPNHEGHKMRPDGQACKTSGPDACACRVSRCDHDAQGAVTNFEMNSACQWWCAKDRCGCHPCLEEDCPQP